MPISVTDDRYSSLELITWWDQNILRKAHVLVVGCGALGNEIVKNLAMLGVGNIYVIDMDSVEKSNLTRSVLFRIEDEGKSKAETICKRAKEINQEINLKYFTGNVFELGLGVFKNCDLIIGGLDNREARLFINQSCWKINRPWIDGAIEVLQGVARMFIPPDNACYECTMSELDYKLINKRKSCMMLGLDEIIEGKIPTTPTIASVIAGIQVQEAVKYLHKRDDLILLNGKGFIFNGNINDSYIVEYTKNTECPSHYTFDNIFKLNKSFQSATLMDVIDYGRNYFQENNFQIEFNNEVVYELVDENNIKIKEFFANLNLLTVKDVKDQNNIYLKPNSFHSLNPNAKFTKRFFDKKLVDMKIPYNDIIIIRSGEKEVYLEFDNMEVFSST